jgi:hypothetical protein
VEIIQPADHQVFTFGAVPSGKPGTYGLAIDFANGQFQRILVCEHELLDALAGIDFAGIEVAV